MIEATCHCGAIRIEVDAALERVTDCNCSICRRRAALWAYFSPRQVRIVPPEGGTLIYMWQDRSIEFHTCKVCHCTTHWAPADKTHDRMAVNARLMAPDVLAAADVHKNDGASW
jgi:hypothetical protein